MKPKYIYFEVNNITGFEPTEPKIENLNILMIKPETNSLGIWSFTNITKRNRDEESYSVVNQYWINLEKYKFGNKGSMPKKLDEYINESLSILDINWEISKK